MDAITLDCLAEWFILVGRRLEVIPPDRARFVERRISIRAEAGEVVRHKLYSENVRVMEGGDHASQRQ